MGVCLSVCACACVVVLYAPSLESAEDASAHTSNLSTHDFHRYSVTASTYINVDTVHVDPPHNDKTTRQFVQYRRSS
eukprot:m.75388 g.75388  ORF g.75388 m.75388 type:complete len:77 (-) comp8990_c1_seq4:1298-1528(-)